MFRLLTIIATAVSLSACASIESQREPTMVTLFSTQVSIGHAIRMYPEHTALPPPSTWDEDERDIPPIERAK